MFHFVGRKDDAHFDRMPNELGNGRNPDGPGPFDDKRADDLARLRVKEFHAHGVRPEW
jgi:hypothetical protein